MNIGGIQKSGMRRVSAQSMIPLAMALAYAPHIGHMPIWVSVFFCLLMVLHLLSRAQRSEIGSRRSEVGSQRSEIRGQHTQRFIIPHGIAHNRTSTFGNDVQNGFISPRLIRFLRLPLTVLGLAGVLLFWNGKLGPVSGTALLSLMLGIKSLEIKGYRDQMITVFTAGFVLFATALFSQSLLIGTYILLATWILLTTLGAVNGQQIRPALRTSGLILAQALPLALAFFILFPRLPGSLFGLTHNPSSGRTGLSSTLSPGSISQLIPSNTPAFRAEFEGKPPARGTLYWRAAVLRDHDGSKWTAGRRQNSMNSKIQAEKHKTQGLDLHISLEPHNSRMLPALDIPIHSSNGTHLLPGQVVRAQKPVTQSFAYNLTAVPELSWPPMSRAERLACLDVDAETNPRTRKLLGSLFPAQAKPRQKLQAILHFFQDQDFAYTLSPPRLPTNDPIDAFLFETKAGYCEHYAQAAVWMARAAGIPARIVVGYQGGEYNPLAEFILVRESDAHAWGEVWLPPKGWTRVDPTSFVAPERIGQGIRHIHPELFTNPLWDVHGLQWAHAAWNQVNMTWNALNYNWREWVIGYSNQKQSGLLASLGLHADIRELIPHLMVLAVVIFLGFMLFLTALMVSLTRRDKDPVQTLYLRFQKKLARAGIQHLAHEGPMDLACRTKELRPDLGPEVYAILCLYIEQRFGPAPSKDRLRRLRRAVGRFRPRTRSEVS